MVAACDEIVPSVPGLVVLLALGERLAEVGVGAEVERRLVLLVLEREVRPVGS